MATGGSTLDDDPELCSLCLDLFQDPKFLPCHHTFCATCIENLARCHTTLHFPCPQCRKDTYLPQDGVSGLQGNFYVKAKDRKVYCRDHRDEKLKFCCLDCEEVVCCECRLTSHVNHTAQDIDIDSFIRQKKADLKADESRLKTAVASLTQQLDTAQRQRQRQNVKHSTDSVKKALRQRHAAVVKHANELLDKHLALLQTYKDSLTQRQDDVTRQDSLHKINDMIKELDNVVTNGSAEDVVAVAKEMRNGRGSEESLQRMTSSTAVDFAFPVHKTLTTVAAMKKKVSAFLGTVTPSVLSTPEVTVVEKFNCGDDPNTTVFSINHVDEASPLVWVSYEQYAQLQDVPEKAFHENGTIVGDGSRVGKASQKRFGKGWCMGTYPQTDGLITFTKTMKPSHYQMDNDFCGKAELDEVTVTSFNPFDTKLKPTLTINVGPHRALDVDQTQNVFIVVEEATPPNMFRKVLMYRRPGRNPVTTYTPPTPTFQPSDVCFYTLGGQQVLLVSDQANDAIHVVSVVKDTLSFERFLTRDCQLLVCPTAMNVDVHGRLWVACKGGRVLTIQPIEAPSPYSL